MRPTALAIMILSATFTISIAPTALADCYQPETTSHDAAGASVSVTTYDCSYDGGWHASWYNSTDVRVAHEALGGPYHVVYRDEASSYQLSGQTGAYDRRRIVLYEGDNEWNADKRVSVNVYDQQNTFAGQCSGVSDTWVDVWFHGIGQYQGVWTRSGSNPYGQSWLLPCDWNDALLA